MRKAGSSSKSIKKASAIRKGELARMFGWTFFKGSAALVLGILISAGLIFKQWFEGPISIRPFTVVEASGTAGIYAAALADQTKAKISKIYSESGDLFQQRKLGEANVPLDVKIGDTGWTLQLLAHAFGIPLTSADVSASIVQDGDKLILQWTTVKPGDVKVQRFPISGAETSPLKNVDKALACLALRTVADLSPDVAANYMDKQNDASDSNSGEEKCVANDDVELYGRVSRDETLPPATRVNALVGLSVHFSYLNQWFEELSMAEAATNLASRARSCDDRHALPWLLQRLKCAVIAYSPFSGKDLRAEIAAWMQLGAALSDYAAAAPTLGEMRDRRQRAIAAYEKVIAIKSDYADAHDALGFQYSALNKTADSKRAYEESLKMGETPAAHMDLGLLFIHGRNDSLDQRDIRQDELSNAEDHFRKAIELFPDYWDAYGRLGYVYYQAGNLIDAVDVLKTAVQHDESNRSLRLLLGSVYAGQCRLDRAKASFQSAYKTYIKNGENDNALDVISDWGKALAGLGLSDWGIARENDVLAANPTHVNALRIRGEIEIETSGMDPFKVKAGLADLKAAIDHDSPKTENDPPKSDAVLSAYLEALVRIGRAADAVTAYEAWSRDGFVPPLATTSSLDATILPITPNTRLAYTKALLKNGEWQSASHEFAVLLQQGVSPGTLESADLPARSANAGVDSAILTYVSTTMSDTARGAGRPQRKHECNLPAMSRQLLLTGGASLIPVQEFQADAL